MATPISSVPVVSPWYPLHNAAAYLDETLPYFLSTIWGYKVKLAPWRMTYDLGHAITMLSAAVILLNTPIGGLLFLFSPLFLSGFGGITKNRIYNMRAYLAIVGWAIALSAYPVACYVMLPLWCIQSAFQSTYFRDEKAFWYQAEKQSPESPQARENVMSIMRGEIAEAFQRGDIAVAEQLIFEYREKEKNS